MSSAGNEDLGLQAKPMGLKVHYTFDKDCQDRCLARHPQLIHAQTLALDETTTIGLVDIRLCLQAVSQCSPELLSGFDSDYVVYAYDYSEPGAPLVGQGMLSWLLDPNRTDNANQSLSMVTGRVTKNMLAIFGNGIKETLEVRLKLVQNNKVQRTDQPSQMQPFSQNSPMNVGTPHLDMGMSSQPMDASTPSAEWNFFMQSMPGFDTQGHIGSPLPMDDMSAMNQPNANANPQPAPNASTTAAQSAPSRGSSRPASRTSRKRQPTGRPRGRPRKRPAPEGHTSGYEDGTDGDDNPGPARKRVATTKVSDRAVSAPFATTPDSLRVAASTSGSLRSFRPLGAGGSDGPAAGSHLQDQPRAPTPVPNAEKLGRKGRGGAGRRPSALGQEQSNLSASQSFTNSQLALSPNGEDAHSPSVAQTPAAFSEDSTGEIGSSPPVPRPSRFMQSSPPPSSPVLPPIPQHDSGFMSGGMEEQPQFGEPKFHDGFMTDAPSAPAHAPQPAPAPKEKDKDKDKDKVPVQYFRLQEGKGGMQDLVQVVSPYSTKPANEADGPRRRGERRGSQPGPRRSSLGANDVQRASSAKPNLTGRQSPALPVGQSQNRAPKSSRSTPVPAQDHQAYPPPPAPPAAPAPQEPSPAYIPTQPQVNAADFQQPPVPDVAEAFEQFRYPPPDAVNAYERFQTPASDVANDYEQFQPPASDANELEQPRPQSMGALTLPDSQIETTPVPGEEDTSNMAPPEPTQQPNPPMPPRSTSFHDLPPPPIPASDPVGPAQRLDLPNATSFSEAPCPASEADALRAAQTSPPPSKCNKNYVKKQSIKARLEQAVMNGEMPQYCTNCGAIETPTWRKISTQDVDGRPCYYEYSEKAGHVTAIEVLARNDKGEPTKHRLIKKALAADEDRTLWQTRLLCNPCGIWLSKNNKHRPEDRWAKDRERLGQDRRRKGAGRNPTRRKKSTGKDARDSMPPLTSEAGVATDGLAEGMTPDAGAIPADQLASILEAAASRDFDRHIDGQKEKTTASGRSGFSNAGSVGTRGTGTAGSPIAVDEEEMGSTRRLLFPSPRHKGVRDVLSPISPNIVSQPQEENKELAVEGAAEVVERGGGGFEMTVEDELESLFRSPVARPSTPPPRDLSSGGKNPLFKTPRTGGTPTHRPVTRSVSKSIRSMRSSPAAQLALLQTTPTRTPRRLFPPESPVVRRSPRINSATKGGMGLGLGIGGSRMGVGVGEGMEMSSQADLEAILDRCLGSWPEEARWDEMGEEWDLEGLGMMGGRA